MSIGSYAFFWVLGMIAGLIAAVSVLKFERADGWASIAALLVALLGALVGSTLQYRLETLPVGEALAMRPADLLSEGRRLPLGLLLGGLSAGAWLVMFGLRWRELGDALAVEACVVSAIGRIGCMVWGCCQGVVCPPTLTALCWQFPPGTEAYRHQIHAGLISPGTPLSLPAHPLALYFSLTALLMLCVLVWLLRHGASAGTAFVTFCIAQPIVKLALETLRAEPRPFLLMVGIPLVVLLYASSRVLPGLMKRGLRTRYARAFALVAISSVVVPGLAAAGPDPCSGGSGGCDPLCNLAIEAHARGRLVGTEAQLFVSATKDAISHIQFSYIDNDATDSYVAVPPGDRSGLGDQVTDWALAHGKAVLGQHIIWAKDDQAPLSSWQSLSEDALRTALTNHINAKVGHYRGRIRAWTAVNEAIRNSAPYTLRNNVLKDKLGIGYVPEIFQIAHDADPDAILLYNDFGAEGVGAKADSVYNHVKKWKEDGVPIGGVGLQMHIGANDHPNFGNIQVNIQRLVNLGLTVEITEMDVEVDSVPAGWSEQRRFDEQRNVYREVIKACLAVVGCTAVTIFGVDDPHSWLETRPGLPDTAPPIPGADALMFDAFYRRKPAYYGVLEAFRGLSVGCVVSESGHSTGCP